METSRDRALWNVVNKRSYEKQSQDAQRCIAAGANINCQRPIDPYSDDDIFKRTTPLLVAITNHTPRLVKRLLELGADPNAATGAYGERTVLHMASLHNQSEIVGMLIGAGVSLEHKDTIYGWTALHIAVGTGFFTQHKTVRMLIAKGANVNATDHDGRTPLHIALEYFGTRNHRRLLEVLLAGGADLSAKTVDGMYPDASYVEQWRPDWDSDEHEGSDEDERRLRDLKTLLDEERLRRGARGLAFAMGQHERLGVKSWVQYLEPDVVRMVMQYV
jgi:hypothetical protein